jgi:hypothetical protein
MGKRRLLHPEARLSQVYARAPRPFRTWYKIVLQKADGSGHDVRESKANEDPAEALKEARVDREFYLEFGNYDSAWIYQEWR